MNAESTIIHNSSAKEMSLKKWLPFIFALASGFIQWPVSWIREAITDNGDNAFSMAVYIASQVVCMLVAIILFLKVKEKHRSYRIAFYILIVLVIIWSIGFWIYLNAAVSLIYLIFSGKKPF